MIRQEAIDFDSALAVELKGLAARTHGTVRYFPKDPDHQVFLTAQFVIGEGTYREDFRLTNEQWKKAGPHEMARVMAELIRYNLNEDRLRPA